MEVFSIIIVTLFGLVMGSFLAMLVYRLPLGISLLNPKRSFCPQCNHQIKWYENIPLFSYLYLKGICSHCKTKISILYPIVEFTTAMLTLLLFLKLGLNNQFFILLVLFYSLIVLSFIDLKYKAVPDYLLLISLSIAIVYTVLYHSENIVTIFIFAGAIVILEMFVTFYIQNIKSKIVNNESLKEQKSLGEGDIPIFAIIGGLLGVQLGIVAIFLSAILAIIPSIINILIKKDSEIPFIPFLFLGLIIVYLGDFYILDLMNIIYDK